VRPKCGQGSQVTVSARSSADCQGEADGPDEASSSRELTQQRDLADPYARPSRFPGGVEDRS
jgi:hypothetical protein